MSVRSPETGLDRTAVEGGSASRCFDHELRGTLWRRHTHELGLHVIISVIRGIVASKCRLGTENFQSQNALRPGVGNGRSRIKRISRIFGRRSRCWPLRHRRPRRSATVEPQFRAVRVYPVAIRKSGDAIALRPPMLLAEVLPQHVVILAGPTRAMLPFTSIEMAYSDRDPVSMDATLTIVVRR